MIDNRLMGFQGTALKGGSASGSTTKEQLAHGVTTNNKKAGSKGAKVWTKKGIPGVGTVTLSAKDGATYTVKVEVPGTSG